MTPGCYVPQMICASWEEDGNGGYRRLGQMCNHRDKLLDVILLLKETKPAAAAYLNGKCNGDPTTLLTTKIEWGGEKMLLLHRVYLDMCNQFIS